MHRRIGLFRVLALWAGLAVIGGARPAMAVEPVGPAASGEASPPKTGPGANFTREAYVEGLRDAPALLAKAGVACTVRQAVAEAESTLVGAGKMVSHARLYEVACDEGLGYLVSDRGDAPPVTFDCIAAAQTGKIACVLPLNAHPAGGLDPSMKAAGFDCAAIDARFIGEDPARKLRRYEVRCDGGGYVLDVPLADGSGPAPQATPCFELEDQCHLVSHADNVASLAYRVGKSFGDGCRVGDARYIGYIAAHEDQLYEVSCQLGHDGELFEIDNFGALKSSQPCSKIKLVGAACQLKPGDAIDRRIVEAESAGVAQLPAPVVRPSVITTPDWVRKPTAEDVANYYPDRAAQGRINGRAVLHCHVIASGSLQGCVVASEDPVGFSFGAAALRMAPLFKMRPLARDGQPVAGARVTLPIVFGIRRN